MSILRRALAALVLSWVLIRGISYAFYLLIGRRILSASGHVPNTALPYDFIFATVAVDFAAGALAGWLITRVVPGSALLIAGAIGTVLTIGALLQTSSPHWNEWAMQFVPFAGIMAGAYVAARARRPAMSRAAPG